MPNIRIKVFLEKSTDLADHNILNYILIPKGALMLEEHLPVRVVRRHIKPVDLSHQIHRTATVLQVGPFATIPDGKDAVCHCDGAALLDAEGRRPVEACPEHVHAQSSIFGGGALVELFEGHAVLESTLLYELFAWDVFVLVRHAHREAEIHLRARVFTGGAEFEHVAEALLRAMHARDAIVFMGDTGSMLVSVHKCNA